MQVDTVDKEVAKADAVVQFPDFRPGKSLRQLQTIIFPHRRIGVLTEPGEFVPDDIEARQLRATFGPDRLDPPTGPESPELVVKWYRGDPHDWFRIDYTDPNTGFHAGWHQDEDHPDLGRAHFQYSVADEADRWGITFEHGTPSLVLWEIVEAPLKDVRPNYQYANEQP